MAIYDMGVIYQG